MDPRGRFDGEPAPFVSVRTQPPNSMSDDTALAAQHRTAGVTPCHSNTATHHPGVHRSPTPLLRRSISLPLSPSPHPTFRCRPKGMPPLHTAASRLVHVPKVQHCGRMRRKKAAASALGSALCWLMPRAQKGYLAWPLRADAGAGSRDRGPSWQQWGPDPVPAACVQAGHALWPRHTVREPDARTQSRKNGIRCATRRHASRLQQCYGRGHLPSSALHRSARGAARTW